MSYTRSFYGVHTIVFDPEDFTGHTVRRIISEPGTDTIMIVTPNLVTSSPDIQRLSLKRRGCYYGDEVCIIYDIFC